MTLKQTLLFFSFFAAFGLVASATPMTGSIFVGAPSDCCQIRSFGIGSGSNTLSTNMFYASVSSSLAPILLTNYQNPPAAALAFSAANVPIFAGNMATFNGTELGLLQDPSKQYTISYNFQFPVWSGGTVSNTSGLAPGNGPVIWSYSVSNGQTTFTGWVRLLDPQGNCVFCENYTGTASVNGGVTGVYGDSFLNISLTGDASPQTPEPGSAALAGVALVTFAALVRKRRA